MRIAVLSDVHSNWHALEACMDHARSQGAQAFAFLGDLVGYGAYPAQVVERIMALASEGALVIQGNHDAMAVSPPTALMHVGDHGAAWTHAQLSPAQRAWLAGLPLTVQQGPLLLVHASAERPERWRYVTDSLAAQHSAFTAALPATGQAHFDASIRWLLAPAVLLTKGVGERVSTMGYVEMCARDSFHTSWLHSYMWPTLERAMVGEFCEFQCNASTSACGG